MPGTFDDLGIAPELVADLATMGWAAPTGLQRDAIPVVRRGNNAVLYASAGAGTVGAYGLGILDRLASIAAAGAPRALVLVGTTPLATATAASLARLAGPARLSVRALAPGWADRAADLLVASAPAALAGVRDSSLKLDGLIAFVVDGADQLAALGEWDALETLLEATPADTQRILVTARFGDPIDGLIDRHVRKALTIPPRPTDDPDGRQHGFESPVRYVVTPERDRLAAAVFLLQDAGAEDIAVVCRDAERAAMVAGQLRDRGLATPEGSLESRVLVLSRVDADQRSTRAGVLSYDPPTDSTELTDLHGKGGTVLVSPRELTHLRVLARRTGASLEPLRIPAETIAGEAEAVRARLRDTIRTADLAADLALVEPLLDEFPAPELAAAALHLARTTPARPAARSDSPRAGRHEGRDRTAAPAAPPPSTAWVRLFVTAGSRDGLGPGDLVGAITGESGLKGDQVGKIEIRESHSTVEVPGETAEAVIKALNGRSLRGRSLRVDYDRKERTPRRPSGRSSPRPGGPPRGGPGRGGPRPGGRRGPDRG
jgi:ATP-dependent RNA helicase DeaD